MHQHASARLGLGFGVGSAEWLRQPIPNHTQPHTPTPTLTLTLTQQRSTRTGEPGVLERLSGRGPLLGIRIEQATHEVLGLHTDAGPLRPTHVDDPLDDLVLQHVLVGIVERELACGRGLGLGLG